MRLIKYDSDPRDGVTVDEIYFEGKEPGSTLALMTPGDRRPLDLTLNEATVVVKPVDNGARVSFSGEEVCITVGPGSLIAFGTVENRSFTPSVRVKVAN